MPLKRGSTRRSCDFCFRRKIRCDRSTRITQKFDACSACQDRKISCQGYDNDEQMPNHHRYANGRDEVERGIDGGAAPTKTGKSQQYHDHFAGAFSVDSAQSTYIDPTFSLNFDSLAYLDEIFGNDVLDSSFDSGPFAMADDLLLPGTSDRSTESKSGDDLVVNPFSGSSTVHVLTCRAFSDSQISQKTLISAIHAYFDYAAAGLPFLSSEAFWSDYNSGICSLALVCAVACRGTPFTEIENKWNLQQRLASIFRREFLRSRATVRRREEATVRLDDLEALALMFDFQYEDEDEIDKNMNIAELYLTETSLILLLLRHSQDENAERHVAPISRQRERRILLYWYIFGIDAFHCLNKQQLSCLPDVVSLTRGQKGTYHEAESYFDAILELAVITHDITRKLCSPAVQIEGINPEDIEALYDQLAFWRSRAYQGISSTMNTVPAESETHSDWRLQLRTAILIALDVNCVMQIEACISKHGLTTTKVFMREAACLKIQSECLCAVSKMLQICSRITQSPQQHKPNNHPTFPLQRHSLIDLSPSILRDVCAGLYFWLSSRAKEIVVRPGPAELRYTSDSGSNEVETLQNYKAAAQTLIGAVASATSHHDTNEIVRKLKSQFAEPGDILSYN